MEIPHTNSINRPEWLDHYLSTNDAHGRLKQEYDACASIKHPIRVIPPEVLGHIFAFAVDTPGFNRFIDVARLRAVCSSWRQVALRTPGLWTSLTIDLYKWCQAHAFDEEETLWEFKDDLSPWLAILDRSNPYHLILTSCVHDPNLDERDFDYQQQLVHHLLRARPQPGNITIDCLMALYSTELFKSACPRVTEVEITARANQDIEEGWSLEKHLFPNLEALTLHGSIDFCQSPFAPSSLRTLHLDDLVGEPFVLLHLVQDLPALCELYLSSKNGMDEEDWDPYNSQPYTHRSLQTLTVSNESLLFPLSCFSFPCLRFLGLHGHGLDDLNEDLVEADILVQIFAKSASDPRLLVSLRGSFLRRLLSQVITCLPCSTHLHLDVSQIARGSSSSLDSDSGTDCEDDDHATIPIQWDNFEAVYCGEHTLDLRWIPATDPEQHRSSHPITIYLPEGYGKLAAARDRRGELRNCGIELQELEKESFEAKLSSLAPQWWKF
ncbi:hypothetical protein BKA70DRAFT_1267317 [Coprinopsis sp. MPI-PUGE-AT-0042]|nr:hypothetical protein BKA70DRAFT_1267317 [Coprinopsis sp. MPI-PUGE-AT-0042]